MSDVKIQDEKWMRYAIQLAAQGELLGEVPVGAVIVRDGEILSEGFNQPITSHDPSAHAEIIAIRIAAKREQNYRLINSTIYVTLEPCTMCVGALVHARISRLVYGTVEPKAGAVESRSRLLESEFFNHRLDAECHHKIFYFFWLRRASKKELHKKKIFLY